LSPSRHRAHKQSADRHNDNVGGGMSERTSGSARAPAKALIRNPRDFWGGLALVLVAVFAIWASGNLPGMRGFAFGPGTAPRLFAYCLMGLGAWIMVVGLFTDGPPMERFTFSGTFGGAVLVIALIPIYLAAARFGKIVPGVSQDIVVAAVGTIVVVVLAFALTNVAPRGPLFITAATIIFAIAVRPLGLVPASFISLVISANAMREVRWIETLVWCAILTAFCAVLFPWGLNLPLPLWPKL
jgi:putative tricarboxylic transport membrane protein